MNIPIYRAKKIDSDEWVKGYLQKLNNKYCFIEECAYGFIRNYIDPNTLAIHFPNMIDKNGKRIFASLSEDGVGGDDVIYKLYEGKKAISVARYRENQFHYCQNTVEVIGIHKG